MKGRFHELVNADLAKKGIQVFDPTSTYAQLQCENDGGSIAPYLSNIMQLVEYYAQCAQMSYFPNSNSRMQNESATRRNLQRSSQ